MWKVSTFTAIDKRYNENGKYNEIFLVTQWRKLPHNHKATIFFKESSKRILLSTKRDESYNEQKKHNH